MVWCGIIVAINRDDNCLHLWSNNLFISENGNGHDGIKILELLLSNSFQYTMIIPIDLFFSFRKDMKRLSSIRTVALILVAFSYTRRPTIFLINVYIRLSSGKVSIILGFLSNRCLFHDIFCTKCWSNFTRVSFIISK